MGHVVFAAIPPVLWPGVAIAALMLAAFAIFLVRSPAPTGAASRERGSALLPSVFIRYYYWLTTPLTTLLDKLGVTPNHITAMSVLIAAASGIFIAQGRFMLGTWVFVAAITCDMLDGLLARSSGRQSVAGAFFDSFCDRLSEGLIFGGLAYYGRNGWLLVASVAAFIASFLVSYARARGESLGVDLKIGLMQRPERMLVMVFTLFSAALLPALFDWGDDQRLVLVTVCVAAVAVLTFGTAVRRARVTMIALAKRDPAEAPSASDPNP